jgi:flagellar biosynthesis GTPase FlhF
MRKLSLLPAICLTILIMNIIIQPIQAQDGIAEVILKNNKQALVTFVKAKRKSEIIGTGFIISSDGVVMTNDHLFDDTSFLVRDNQGKFYKIENILLADQNRDIRLLKLEKTKQMPVVDFGNPKCLKIGNKLIILSNYNRKDATATKIVISKIVDVPANYQRVLVLETSKTIPANLEGSPVFSTDGKIVAILTTTNGNKGIKGVYAVATNDISILAKKQNFLDCRKAPEVEETDTTTEIFKGKTTSTEHTQDAQKQPEQNQPEKQDQTSKEKQEKPATPAKTEPITEEHTQDATKQPEQNQPKKQDQTSKEKQEKPETPAKTEPIKEEHTQDATKQPEQNQPEKQDQTSKEKQEKPATPAKTEPIKEEHTQDATKQPEQNQPEKPEKTNIRIDEQRNNISKPINLSSHKTMKTKEVAPPKTTKKKQKSEKSGLFSWLKKNKNSETAGVEAKTEKKPKKVAAASSTSASKRHEEQKDFSIDLSGYWFDTNTGLSLLLEKAGTKLVVKQSDSMLQNAKNKQVTATFKKEGNKYIGEIESRIICEGMPTEGKGQSEDICIVKEPAEIVSWYNYKIELMVKTINNYNCRQCLQPTAIKWRERTWLKKAQ